MQIGMKKILSLLCAVLVVVSCSKEENIELASGEGAMRFALAPGSGITSEDDATIKIYKYDDTLMDYQLVRRYTNTDDVPEKLALLAGQYKAVVQVGERMVTSFDKRYYYGEEIFNIVAGQVTPVEVVCDLQSTIVKVVYDENIVAKFKPGFATTVAIDDEYNQAEINSGDVHSLKFSETKSGYFLMPEGQTTLVWQFEGVNEAETGSELPDGSTLEGGKITAGGIIENVKANARYTISLKYSKDAPGGLVISASVDADFDEDEIIDNRIPFSPDPTILGAGFDMSAVQFSTTEALTYNISALATINVIQINIDGVDYDLLANTFNGITLNKIDDVTYTLTIAEAFFNGVTGGEHSLIFNVQDIDGGKATKSVAYKVQGILPLLDEDCDFWFGRVIYRAMVLDETTDVKVAYRANGGEWKMADATKGADGRYSAQVDSFAVSTNYSYKLVVDSVDTGKSLELTTKPGAQVPNADMERWHTASWVLPYGKGDTPFWLTGNEGGNMVGATLTQSSTDVRPGTTGTKSAHLKSQFASLMGAGKFAAGNLFTGTFMLSGMDGIVTFGRDFTFTAKPKSMTCWIKNNEGTIDQGSHASGTDIYTIMVLITDGTTYSVNTKDESSFLKLDKLGELPGVIGYGYLSGKDSRTEWTEETINITYREDMKNAKPKKVVISFTPSGYGDYFCGSTKSWMYVDDVCFNY